MHRRLISLASSAKSALVIGIASGVLAGLCGLAQAYFLSATVDDVFLRGSDIVHAWPWLRLLLAVVLVRGLLLWLQETATNELSIQVRENLREGVLGHLLRLGPAFVRGERSGELASTAADGIEALDAYYSQYLPQLVIGALVPLSILIIVFPLDPLSGGILLLTAPLIPFFMYMIGRTAESATSAQYATLGRLASHLLDSVQGLTTLKVFGQAAAQVQNIARVADQFRSMTLKVLQVSFLSAFALELLATISTAVIAVEVALRLLYGNMVFREALFILVVAPEFYLPLRMLGLKFHAGMSGVAAGGRIFQILDTPAPPISPAELSISSQLPASGSPKQDFSVKFKDVEYAYPGSPKPALHNINLEVRHGEHVAIVGASGAGKSTFAGLVLGFLTPSSGTVQVRSWLRAARPLIGWVPQDPHLFHESLAANMRLGRSEASDAEMAAAAKLAHLDDFAASLPDGYATIVGEGGARLSSGERQRLALARAFLADAEILVLDEPSASLDPENEALLGESLRVLARDRTMITIAHRLNTVRNADRILVLDNGCVVEAGTHAKLRAAGGQYARLLAAGALEASARDDERAELGAGRRKIAFLPGSGIEPSSGSSVPPELESVGGVGGRSAVRQLLGFLRGSWGWVALSALLGTLTIGSSVALMGTSAWLISAAALHPSIASLQVAIVGVRLFGISRAVFRYLERLVSHSVTFRMLRNIRVWAYSCLEPLAPARLMDFRIGDVVARLMADVESLENFYGRVLAPSITAVSVLSAVTAFLLIGRSADLALMLIVVFCVAGLAVPLSASLLAQNRGAKLVQVRAGLQALLVDSIQGMPDILAFRQGEQRLALLRRQGTRFAAGQRQMARLSGIDMGLSAVLANFAVWLALVLLIPTIHAGEQDGVMLAALVLVILASFEATSSLPLAGRLWPATRAAASRLQKLARTEPAVQSPPAPLSRRADIAMRLRGAGAAPSIEYRHVSFTYPGRRLPAIRDISFSIPSGGSLAIVGPSGSGKSTIANLLLRFWDYEIGDILLDGISVKQLAPDDVRAQIGYASQHTYLFDTSVFENLRLARRSVSRADVERAAAGAQIHDMIEELPEGYQALIGEHGARLSAGERQRIGLARLLLRDAPIMLLDEPTANLDTLTESGIVASIRALMQHKTSLLITHRLIGMKQVDQILVMEHGEIVERGSHAQLLVAGGLYASLWHLQNHAADETLGPVAAAA